MMINLRQKILTAVVILGVSVGGFAQRGNDNKRPQKDNPPQVVVKEKDKPPPPPKKDDKKKP